MKRINILPSTLTSKIAAGEVIERPASVIKELLENSLDARADSVEIDLQAAGKKFIRIKDNGSGIYPDDMEKLFNRHATSKLSAQSNLESISSFGFRGEALYSIGSVSDIIFKSKLSSAETGWENHTRGNKQFKLSPASIPEGTEIEINELFFNTPARKKFLKSDSTEMYHILNTVTLYSLIFPKVSFTLTHNNKTRLKLNATSNTLDRIKQALKIDPKDIITVEKKLSQKNMNLKIFLGNINIKRNRRDMQFIFVNNRPVQYNRLRFHINKAYESLFFPGAFPAFLAFIEVPPENVDVNIHPAKQQVKINDEYTLSTFLRSVCQEALSTQGQAQEATRIHPFLKPFEEQKPGYSFTTDRNHQPQQFAFSAQAQSKTDSVAEPQESFQNKNIKTKLSTARFIGNLLKKYLFFEAEDSLLIIDQHAAHERINFELFLNQIKTGHLETQHLLQPILIPVSSQELIIWNEVNETLESIGFSTRQWDEETIALHTHPQLIKKPEIALKNLLVPEKKDKNNYDKDILASKACHNSIRTGYLLSAPEALSLKDHLLRCNNPLTCPHGRPTIVEIPENIFQKQFLRT